MGQITRNLRAAVLADRVVCGWVLAIVGAIAVSCAVHSVRFICLRYGLDGGWLLDPVYSIETDLGFAELLNYAQTMALVVLLVRLGGRHRELVYPAFAVVFLLVLVDDVFGFNQPLGARLADTLGVPAAFGFAAHCIAELIVFAAIGSVIALGLIGALYRARAPHRQVGYALTALCAVLGFFAIVIDLVHIAYIYAFFGSRLLFELLEEGGEMITIATTLTLVLVLSRRPQRSA